MPANADLDLREEATNTPILIKAYGEYWKPELVNWNRTWRLLGKRRPDLKGPDINVFEERGVYVLFKDYEAVYVGKADRQSIGYRLQLHRLHWHQGPRWNSFSWFGIRGLRKNGKQRKLNSAFHLKTSELIATLEALLIMASDPRMNRRREKFKNAVRLFQSETDKPMEMDDRLGTIERQLEQLLAPRGSV